MEMYEFEQFMEEFMEFGLGPMLLTNSWSFLLSIAAYVLTSLGLYTMATRRGIQNAWLSWVPVINCWIIGSLSDQYRYVVKGEVKNKRKALLVMNIIAAIVIVAMLVIAIMMVIRITGIAQNTPMDLVNGKIMEMVMGPVIAVVVLFMVYFGMAIALAVVHYIAMYDIYTSCDPQNNVVFLVLSILFSVTEPFFLFFNRNRDGGMPPRKHEPITEIPLETWDNTEYL